jgi:hypothetical protein
MASVPYLVNVVGLLVVALFFILLAGALLWRVGLWSMPAVEQLHTVEGLSIGSSALEIAAVSGRDQYHLAFGGGWTFLVFGSMHCEPCKDLLRVASDHPATRDMRLVYVGDSEDVDIDCGMNRHWEVYQFDNEDSARAQWRAPVSPYFHVIDPRGRVASKGVGSKPHHLDRLLSVAPVSNVEGSSLGGELMEVY